MSRRHREYNDDDEDDDGRAFPNAAAGHAHAQTKAP